MEDIFLQNPQRENIVNCYRSVNKLEQVNILCTNSQLRRTLVDLEESGFVAIEIDQFNKGSEKINLRAFKGKHGPCYDTGRTVKYNGAALAALDDDNHLILKGQAFKICEKTSQIYQMDPYYSILDVSDADQRLSERLTNDPVPFDCDTFESDQQKLIESLNDVSAIMQRRLLFYPGPFKLLILSDGTIMRRGQVTSIPDRDFENLKKLDRCFTINDDSNKNIVCFQDQYKKLGSAALLGKLKITDISSSQESDFSALKIISPELKEKLLSVISSDKKYFILTGSDPKNELGCCPSEEVGMANTLVESGLLSSYSQPLPDDACPTTIYAFRDEISIPDNEPEFTINQAFRSDIREALKTDEKQAPYVAVIKYVLLAFIVISLFVAFVNTNSNPEHQPQSLYQSLDKPENEQILLVLFHQQKRCELCLNMENFSKSLIRAEFPEIKFRMINLDDPRNAAFVDEYLVSLHIMTFKDKQLDKKVILEEPYKFYRDEEAFTKALSKALRDFKEQLNE